MKIVGLSDIHGHLPDIDELPKADVYCITGDIMPLDLQRQYIPSIVWLTSHFFPWCESLPCDKVFFVAGNHDFLFEYLRMDENGNHRKAHEVMNLLSQHSHKITYLENSEKKYRDYKFYGSPWCPDLMNWAFYKDGEDLVKEFKKIPENTDILLTHCPPKIGYYGTVLEGYGMGKDYGCQELADRLQEIHPKLHIFGHVHSGSHEPQTINGTTFCNVSLKNESYNVTYSPKEFEL